ncbi:N-acetylglucosaminyldiphosphodolichol N-acetylglucosaminyltransferase catalytic subunit alg13 [Linnemannia exigua]|uniref:UDP-N-acetylglucosamine transferase subunit ALG13 n=1 Tax=Linnemannia exigua TaxID=604196 RepID=A0AAD4H9A2_9FUNG|nr:N-acetylglucosaminyldiphosphodolichol N-acetylglucosaminyltransferase catalytic subunit alg13 [Linnemannia exigua]
MPNSVLVTVGSTRFDKLVAAACSSSLQQLLTSLGYSQLTIQHGKSPISSSTTSADSTSKSILELTTYAYKSSLHEDMEQADLIISHAGSGSILEALRLNKKLIVVVNEDLMDNHQMELGSALHEQHYLVCCTVSCLK